MDIKHMVTVFRSGQEITHAGLIVVPNRFDEDGSFWVDQDWCHVRVSPTDDPNIIKAIIPSALHDEEVLQQALSTHFDHMVVGGFRSISGLFRTGDVVMVHLATTWYV